MDPGTAYGTDGHVNDVSGVAPGDLEVVQSFISLHDHPTGGRDSLPPSARTLEDWLRRNGLLEGDVSPAELDRAGAVLEDLRATAVGEATDATRARLDDAARRADLRIHFDTAADRRILPGVVGVDGALGRLLAITFLAQLDGSWDRLRGCANPTCRSVFWDRSKNRSGRWCSMRVCGNQAKVRAYRERTAAR